MSHFLQSCLEKYTQKLVAAFQRSLFNISTHTVEIAGLPENFRGFTIVQISDLHVDWCNRLIVEAAADVVNGLQADLLVCTGDIIADGQRHLPDVAWLLKRFQARYGKLACLGNHDYSDGSGSQGVRQALRKAGFDVLVNDSTSLSVGRQQIQLAGADDLILGSQCLQKTSRRLEAHQPTILLSHNPHNFEAMARFRPDLVLSGHTHGGQIHLPESIKRRIFSSPYIAGHYRYEASQLYVNSGLGSAVFVEYVRGCRVAIPTPRWLVQPEISVFRLTPSRCAGLPVDEAGRRLAS